MGDIRILIRQVDQTQEILAETVDKLKRKVVLEQKRETTDREVTAAAVMVVMVGLAMATWRCFARGARSQHELDRPLLASNNSHECESGHDKSIPIECPGVRQNEMKSDTRNECESGDKIIIPMECPGGKQNEPELDKSHECKSVDKNIIFIECPGVKHNEVELNKISRLSFEVSIKRTGDQWHGLGEKLRAQRFTLQESHWIKTCKFEDAFEDALFEVQQEQIRLEEGLLKIPCQKFSEYGNFRFPPQSRMKNAERDSNWCIVLPRSVRSSESMSDTLHVQESTAVGHIPVSAPDSLPAKECLPGSSWLLQEDGDLVCVDKLTKGTSLKSLTRNDCGVLDFSSVVVTNIRRNPPRDRDFIVATLDFKLVTVDGDDKVYASVNMTADHFVAVCGDDTWEGVPASDLKKGCRAFAMGFDPKQSDGEHIASSIWLEAEVVGNERKTYSCDVFELEFSKPSHAVFLDVGLGNLFAVVFGSLPASNAIVVWDERHTSLHVQNNQQDLESAGPNTTAHRGFTSYRNASGASDPTHNKPLYQPRVIHRIRRPHDANCRAWCKYHFEGRCRKKWLCDWCHHRDHYGDRRSSKPPSHPSRSRKPRQEQAGLVQPADSRGEPSVAERK